MHHPAARSVTRSVLKPVVTGLLVLAAASVPALVARSAPTSASSSTTTSRAGHGEPIRSGAGITVDDGVLPAGVTVFDDAPGVANLDPRLLGALREAGKAAAAAGVALSVNSGWRSRAYQDQLLRDAVHEYGSEREAARWVATADTSPHVSGEAADIGPAEATAWLTEHGAVFGLCQIYRNEPWHFELRPRAAEQGCPRMYADPTRDPRMEP